MHRRFLFFIRNKCLNHDDNILSDQKYVEREMEFTDKCIASCSSDGDEDDDGNDDGYVDKDCGVGGGA